MKKIFRKELIIGITVILALVALFVGIDFLKGINVFKQANYYYIKYDNVAGLAQSAPVTINGYKVGQVREIQYLYDDPGHIQVEISVDKQLRIPQGTKAILSTDLLGTASIQLEMAPGTNFHEIGDQLPGVVPHSMMDAISQDLLPSVGSIVPKVDTLLTNVNTLVSDPALAASVKRLDQITRNLELTSRQLNAVMATLPPITDDVKGITGNLNTVSQDLTVLSADLREAHIDSIANNIQTTTNNLRLLTEQLNNPNSTLGKAMNDPALYDNLNSTISNLDSLFIDIKKNPKRYISIKLL